MIKLKMSVPCVTVSVVSHGQHIMVNELLTDIAKCPEVANLLITHNIPEPDCELPSSCAASVTVLRNLAPKGFGANHNAALQAAKTPFLCILNPDIRFQENPFPALLACFGDMDVSLVSPCVLNPVGEMEDSARYFPTPLGLLSKALGLSDGRFHANSESPCEPDWVAGMFLMIRQNVFRRLQGFDEAYFMYYEDVDFCVRLRKAGHRLVWCPHAKVVHDARRSSRRDLRYMLWHINSMLRYFVKQYAWW